MICHPPHISCHKVHGLYARRDYTNNSDIDIVATVYGDHYDFAAETGPDIPNKETTVGKY